MPATRDRQRSPLHLVVTGEAVSWRPALERIVGPRWLATRKVSSDRELIDVVRAGQADAAVLSDSPEVGLDALQMLRLVRRVNAVLPVVVVTARADRRRLEDALRLAAFSVISRPVQLEELLRQIQRMMIRLDRRIRRNEL